MAGADYLRHDAETLEEVLADAEAELKEKVAAGNSWAETPYNDPEEFPLNHKARLLRNVGLAHGGMVWDPGTTPAERVMEQAMAQQHSFELSGPPYRVAV